MHRLYTFTKDLAYMVSHIFFEFRGQFITLHFENEMDNDVLIKYIIKYLEQEYNARVLYEESDLDRYIWIYNDGDKFIIV